MSRETETLKTYIALMRVHGLFEKVVKEDAGRYNLNVTEFAVMELLYNRGEQPIQKICQRILIASSSTTYVVDKLCNKGFVERRPDEKDRRVTFASITEEGRELMEKLYPEHAKRLMNLFEELSLSEITDMRDKLKRITRYG